MKVALYINASKFNEKDTLIEKFIEENSDIDFFIPQEDYQQFSFKKTAVLEDLNSVDMVFSIGGDGTILSTIHRTEFTNKPVLGLKFGNLGFLTIINFGDFSDFKEQLISGDYQIEKRFLLEVQKDNASGETVYKDYALNDIVLEREDIARMTIIDVFINKEFFTGYHSNGVVVSSATGSTAYNLSAGGPIVYPDSDSIILTPICPHSLSQRPVVLRDKIVEMNIKGRVETAVVTLDGQRAFDLHQKEIVRCKSSGKFINLIKLDNESFPSLLRQKLGWGK